MKRLIRLHEVRSVTGLGRSEIYRLEGLHAFPRRVPLGERTTAWDFDEVQQWVRERIAAREENLKKRVDVGRQLTRARSGAAKRHGGGQC